MRAAVEQRVSTLLSVRRALSDDEILPFYQPRVCLLTGRIVGFEALARLQHPTKGLVTAGQFAVAFDDPELAELIGRTMLRQVTADMRAWLDRGLDVGLLSVNLSSAEFSDPRLADRILCSLEQAGVPPSKFEVEVTESVFLGTSSKNVLSILNKLHESGVTVTLDDFGTGFASLTHLKQFPVDHIKIDRSFVRDLEHSHKDQAIALAVIGLSTNLGMTVTAEGIETDGQAARLHKKGCHYGQGYLYAKPMIGSRVPWFLKAGPGRRDAAKRAAHA
jgi:EAL domain-containing protein (putative c-di-GMP-specific phosphodiesterase class I)